VKVEGKKMKNLFLLLLTLILFGCAHTKTICRSLPRHSLNSFGSFDSTTTIQDIIQRAGKPNGGVSVSGIQVWFYLLSDDSWITIQTDGGSHIALVEHDRSIIFQRK
jgi:hypothetical protein